MPHLDDHDGAKECSEAWYIGNDSIYQRAPNASHTAIAR
jgi:hypothetical protein